MEALRPILDLIKTYGGTLSLVFTWGAIAWVYYSKRADWSRKQFLGQVNFSLNLVMDGQLAMRTLSETAVRDVWLNDIGVKKVLAAASRTTVDQPFVQLPDGADLDFLYRAVLNVLSEQFASGYLAQSMGLPVVSTEYSFAITMERYSDIRTLKLRVLLARTVDLETVFAPESEVATPDFTYVARLKTLRAMAELHRRAGEPGILRLGRVMLTIPC
jgi:hypothetical protein